MAPNTIIRINFRDATQNVAKGSRRFSGRALHATDGWKIEELQPARCVRLSHPKHGIYEVTGLGYALFYADGREVLTGEEYTRMNIPSEFRGVTLDRVSLPARDVIARYCVDVETLVRDGIGLSLCGYSGVGKTSAAVVVAKAARIAGLSVFFGTTTDLRECFRARMPFDGELSVFDRTRTVRLLILDGLSLADADTKDVFLNKTVLGGIVETRRHNKLATIVTTQLTESEVTSNFEFLGSKLKGASPFLHVSGVNQRDQAEESLLSRLGIK